MGFEINASTTNGFGKSFVPSSTMIKLKTTAFGRARG